jgi:peptide/nickel transport system substrate-binding protein
MNKRYARLAAGLLTAMAVGLTISGCGGSGESGGTKSEISVAMNAEPESYDIGKTSASVAKVITLGNVYEMLVNIDGNYQVQPELAETIDVNPDHTEYVYHLRKGVKFHNGEEMKADDVVASMNRWIENVSSVRTAVGDSRFEKVDDNTVKISFAQPLLTFNELIANMKPLAIIVPKSVIEKADPKTGMLTEYIGTGPYKVAEIKPNESIRLEKFDDYSPYGEKGKGSGWTAYKEAKTPTVVFHFVKDASTRVAGIQSGEYDVSVQLPFDDYDQFSDKDKYTVYKEGQGDIFMVYNKKQGLASNKLVRQAVETALNREDILQAAYSNSEFYKIDPSIITDPDNPWYTEAGGDFYNVHNPEKARELLAQAGYNGEEFTLLVSNSYQEFNNAAVVIEKELKDIGLNVKLDVVDWPTYLTRAKDPSAYDAFVTGGPDWVLPSTVIYFSPTWNGWSTDPKLQSMMAEWSHLTDTAAAKKLWEDVQTYCLSDYVPVSKLGNRYVYDVSSSNVKDLNVFEGVHMWNVTVTQ